MDFELREIDIPEGGRSYLKSLSRVLQDEEVYQVLVFGSGSRGDISKFSDLDILIVLERRDDIKRLDSFVSDLNKNVLDNVGQIEYKFDKITGAFIWAEITDKDRFRTGNFSEIFGFPKIANYTTAWRVFLKSAFEDAEIIYGPKIKPEWLKGIEPRDFWFRELIKNLFTSLGFAIIGLVYALLSERGSEYSQEAYKITLYACFVLLEDSSPTIEECLNLLPSYFGVHQMFRQFRNGHNVSRFLFALTVPFTVLLIHIYTFNQIMAESVSLSNIG